MQLTLTLNQVLFLILTVAFVIIAVFLVRFLIQLRRTAIEGQKTLERAQVLMSGMEEIEAKLNASLDEIGQIVQTTKKAATGVSEVARFVGTNVIRPSAKYWPIIFPLVSLAWRQINRKRKEKKDGRK